MFSQHVHSVKSKHYRRSEGGIALLVLVFSIAMVLTAFAYKVLNARASKLVEQQSTAAALAEAKAALIGYAILDSTLPGRLPCPEDLTQIGTVYEGEAKSSCDTDAERIGRLPWRTLGIGKVVDGNGEPLWYALSDHFRAPPINSETIPMLSLDGVANTAVAIIFSPGPALSNQTRTAVTSSSPPSQSNYLDQGNSNLDNTFFRAVSDSTFNDQLIVIKHADIFTSLEKRVLAEIKSNLGEYKSVWNAYPFPSDFINPQTKSNFQGNIGNLAGLLPISDPLVVPNAAVSNISLTSPQYGTSGSQTCNVIGNNFECTIALNPQVLFSCCGIYLGRFKSTGVVNFFFDNVGLGVVETPKIQMTDFNDELPEILASNDPDNLTYGKVSGAVPIEFTPLTLTKYLDANGRGIYKLTYDLDSNGSFIGSGASISLKINVDSTKYPNTQASWSKDTSWIVQNNWHRIIYYQVAAPFIPNGNVTPICNSNCLSIQRTYANGTIQNATNIPGVIMTAGKELISTDFQAAPAQLRSSDSLKEYFDSANNVNAATTLTFDQILPLKSTFNDQLQTLLP